MPDVRFAFPQETTISRCWVSHGAGLQVIALEVSSAGVLVWDLDLKHPGLQFPCTLQQYAGHALQSGTIDLPPQFQRCACMQSVSSGFTTSIMAMDSFIEFNQYFLFKTTAVLKYETLNEMKAFL